MTTLEVGGGYLDFIVIDTHKSGQHADEMFQAILYTSPGKEPEVLMCRPEYMPPGTRKGYRPFKGTLCFALLCVACTLVLLDCVWSYELSYTSTIAALCWF